MSERGKLIVIDGNDGSGKETQFKMLLERLQKDGYEIETIDFPQYYNNFFGSLIGECLAGEHGDFLNLDPKIKSALFAADRWESKAKMEQWLSEGKIVIADRYVSANQIHQGRQIKDEEERREFMEWLEKMEHDVYAIPRPDMVVYISMPVEMTNKLLKNKVTQESKKYLKGKKDVHEESTEFLAQSRTNALKIVAEHNHWVKVECAPKGTLRTREDIHEEVYKEVTNIM